MVFSPKECWAIRGLPVDVEPGSGYREPGAFQQPMEKFEGLPGTEEAMGKR
jgi:hypothetical protein